MSGDYSLMSDLQEGYLHALNSTQELNAHLKIGMRFETVIVR
jgi:hypothetical protein